MAIASIVISLNQVRRTHISITPAGRVWLGKALAVGSGSALHQFSRTLQL